MRYILMGFAIGLVLVNPVFAQGSPATEYVIFYKNEFTFFLCVLILCLSSWLSVKLPDGNIESELSKGAKILSAVVGGILAFLYSLHKDRELTLMNPIWIAIASVTLPVTIITLRNKLSKYASDNITKLTEKGE